MRKRSLGKNVEGRITFAASRRRKKEELPPLLQGGKAVLFGGNERFTAGSTLASSRRGERKGGEAGGGIGFFCGQAAGKGKKDGETQMFNAVILSGATISRRGGEKGGRACIHTSRAFFPWGKPGKR